MLVIVDELELLFHNVVGGLAVLLVVNLQNVVKERGLG